MESMVPGTNSIRERLNPVQLLQVLLLPILSRNMHLNRPRIFQLSMIFQKRFPQNMALDTAVFLDWDRRNSIFTPNRAR